MGYFRTELNEFQMHVLLEGIILLIFDYDFIILILLLFDDQVDVEVFVLDVLRKHLHLGVAFRCLF